MMLRYVITTIVLVVLAAGAVFQLKYQVVRLERERMALETQLRAERWTLQTRKADLAYLTRPDRLALQAAQLGMKPATSDLIVDIKQIGDRQQIELANNPVAVTLPSGAEVELRLKPVAIFTAAKRGRTP